MKKIAYTALAALSFVAIPSFAVLPVSPTSFTATDLHVTAFPAPADPASSDLHNFCNHFSTQALAGCKNTIIGKLKPEYCKDIDSVIQGMEFYVNSQPKSGLDSKIQGFCKDNASAAGQSEPDCVTDTATVMEYSYDQKCNWK